MYMKEYKGMPIYHETIAEASHQPALIYAIENSIGDILELGCGNSSTYLISHMVKNTNRKIVSVEHNYEWMKTFLHMTSQNHSFELAENTNWNKSTDIYCNRSWGVVLVDQGVVPEIGNPARTYSAQRLVNCSEYVIVHDAEQLPWIQYPPKSTEYNWKVFSPKYGGPHTYILSTKHDLKNITINED